MNSKHSVCFINRSIELVISYFYYTMRLLLKQRVEWEILQQRISKFQLFQYSKIEYWCLYFFHVYKYNIVSFVIDLDLSDGQFDLFVQNLFCLFMKAQSLAESDVAFYQITRLVYWWSNEILDHFSYALSSQSVNLLKKIGYIYATPSQVRYDLMWQVQVGKTFLTQLDPETSLSRLIRLACTRWEGDATKEHLRIDWWNLSRKESTVFNWLVEAVEEHQNGHSPWYS